MTIIKLCGNMSALTLAAKRFARSLTQSSAFSASSSDDGHGKPGDSHNNKPSSPFDAEYARDLGYVLNDNEDGEFDRYAFSEKFAKDEWKAKQWVFIVDDNKPVYEGVARKLGYRVYGDGFQKI